MKLSIKHKYYKQLLQCIFLGETVINEYSKDNEQVTEYSDLLKDILQQIIDKTPNVESKLKLAPLPFERTQDILMSDLSDRIFDSVADYYEQYKRCAFCETLAEKIANKNYPVLDCDEADSLDNLLAKNLYYKLLRDGDFDDIVTISATKIDKQIMRAKNSKSN